MRVNSRTEALAVALLPQKGILVQATLVLAASTFTALAAQADGNLIDITQVDALIGNRLQRDAPLRPREGRSRIWIILRYDGRCTGAVGNRHVHRISRITRSAPDPDR